MPGSGTTVPPEVVVELDVDDVVLPLDVEEVVVLPLEVDDVVVLPLDEEVVVLPLDVDDVDEVVDEDDVDVPHMPAPIESPQLQ